MEILNKLKKTYIDTQYMTYQKTCLSYYLQSSHTTDVKFFAKYLHGTKDKSLIVTPDPSNLIELYPDACWSGNWQRKNSEVNKSTAKSRTEFFLVTCHNGDQLYKLWFLPVLRKLSTLHSSKNYVKQFLLWNSHKN